MALKKENPILAPPSEGMKQLGKVASAEKELSDEILKWHVAIVQYSGGKDSTAIAFMALNALKESEKKPGKIIIAYINGGVDLPEHVRTAEAGMRLFCDIGKKAGLSVESVTLHPKIDNSYWIGILGKGYLPPAKSSKWCVPLLKNNPMKQYILRTRDEIGWYPLVISGLRMEESAARKASIPKYMESWKISRFNRIKQCEVYMPILDFSAGEVWRYIETSEKAWGVKLKELHDMYTLPGISREKIRTGCWACTLARRDPCITARAKKDPEIAPYAEFRNYLCDARRDSTKRREVTRWGRTYLNGFTLATRKELYDMLKKFMHLGREEDAEIKRQWKLQQ